MYCGHQKLAKPCFCFAAHVGGIVHFQVELWIVFGVYEACVGAVQRLMAAKVGVPVEFAMVPLFRLLRGV